MLQRAIAAGALTVGIAATTAAAGLFQVIGALYQFLPFALSGDGSTLAGEALVPPLGYPELGATWTASGGLTFLPSAGAVPYSIPTASSRDASVLVGHNTASDNTATAWRYTAAGGYQFIAPAGSPYSTSTSVSDDGKTVAGGTLTNYFVWTAGGGTTVISMSPNGPALLSGDGSMLVAATGDTSAFTWTAAGGVKPLSAIAGAFNIAPAAISADGSRIYGTATTNKEIVFSYANGVMTSLGSPTFYDPVRAGLGVVGASSDGSVLVGRQVSFDQATNMPLDAEWVWTRAGGFIALDDYLSAAGVTVEPGYRIAAIRGISADGKTIFGNGAVGGIQQSGWMAVVPEPTSVLAGAGCAALGLRPRRAR